MGKLDGKIALVVGGGQTPGLTVGNGKATALLFAREGAFVVVADWRLEAAQDTVADINGEGGKALAVRADIASESDIAEMVRVALSVADRIDVLHNNVGVSITGGDAPIEEVTATAFTRVVDINLRGMALTCKAVLPHMRQRESGAIINISSAAALITHGNIAYRTSKAAVIALTENIAGTHAKYGIRANVILPGLMNTPMAIENRIGRNGATREQILAERQARVPLKGAVGTGWDVAKAALFLASDDSAYITGTILKVDAGQTLGHD